MRAIGFTKAKIQHIYIYESFILIVSSSLLGALIGLTMGWILLISYSRQEKIAFNFYFPFQ